MSKKKQVNKLMANYNTDIFGKVVFGSVCGDTARAESRNKKSYSAYSNTELMASNYALNLIGLFNKDEDVFLNTHGTFEYYNAHLILEYIGL